MKDTKIEWCDSTVNPTGFQCQGCELWRPAQGIKECYAGRFAERIGGVGAFDQPVVMKPGRMAEAARWSDLRGKARPDKPWIPKEYPRIIFIGDMADTFQRGVEFQYLFDEVIQNVVSEHGRRHVWMWLTKDAKRLAGFWHWMKQQGCNWPENLWPGVSITSQATEWRLAYLCEVPSDHRFVSYEPAWEWVNFETWLWEGYKDEEGFTGADPSYKISLIIIGGESGAGAAKHPFNVEWARKLIEDCEDAQVACFVKQLGAVQMVGHPATGWQPGSPLKHSKGGDWSEWPEDLRVRQLPELP
jgi:protein gp37